MEETIMPLVEEVTEVESFEPSKGTGHATVIEDETTVDEVTEVSDEVTDTVA